MEHSLREVNWPVEGDGGLQERNSPPSAALFQDCLLMTVCASGSLISKPGPGSQPTGFLVIKTGKGREGLSL